MYYPFFVSEISLRIPKIEWNDESREWITLEDPINDEIIVYPIDENGLERRWKWGIDRVLKNPNEFCIKKDRTGSFSPYVKARMNDEGVLPLTWWDKKEYSATAYGTNLIKEMFNRVDIFSYPKSLHAVEDCLTVLNLKNDSFILDYFAGSGTTIHAVINQNRSLKLSRKYIGIEMGKYFQSATLPRIQKAIYTDNWKNGKPQDKKGISQMFKYMVLESYEDTLNNLSLQHTENQQGALALNEKVREEYLLQYMLDVESHEHLFNLNAFKNPFTYQLNVTENNELVPITVDLVETFNYLIGLKVQKVERIKEFKLVTGENLKGDKTLVIWRNLEKTNNDDLNRFVEKLDIKVFDGEFDIIYVNGDNNLANFKKEEENWKVRLIEEEFFNKMFDVKDI